MFSPPPFRIDARLVDDLVFDVIKGCLDPETKLSKITLEEISEQAGCHVNTASRAAHRLAVVGRVQKIGGRGRSGLTFKVIEDAQLL